MMPTQQQQTDREVQARRSLIKKFTIQTIAPSSPSHNLSSFPVVSSLLTDMILHRAFLEIDFKENMGQETIDQVFRILANRDRSGLIDYCLQREWQCEGRNLLVGVFQEDSEPIRSDFGADGKEIGKMISQKNVTRGRAQQNINHINVHTDFVKKSSKVHSSLLPPKTTTTEGKLLSLPPLIVIKEKENVEGKKKRKPNPKISMPTPKNRILSQQLQPLNRSDDNHDDLEISIQQHKATEKYIKMLRQSQYKGNEKEERRISSKTNKAFKQNQHSTSPTHNPSLPPLPTLSPLPNQQTTLKMIPPPFSRKIMKNQTPKITSYPPLSPSLEHQNISQSSFAHTHNALQPLVSVNVKNIINIQQRLGVIHSGQGAIRIVPKQYGNIG